jgi:uncharacterized protein
MIKIPMSIGPQIEIHTVKRVNLKGGTLIDGFPSGGLTNSIASMCFMNSVVNDLVSVIDSPSFPPVSMVYDGIANFPTRIYANEDLKVAFLISELNLDPSLYYYVSRIILRWAKENGCELVISAGTVFDENSNGSQKGEATPSVFGVASTKKARDRIRDTKMIRYLPNGSVSGIPALMLNEGMITNFDVIVLLGKTIQDTSDYGPAASVSEAIMKLVPGLSCDTRSLLAKAKTFEQDLRRVRSERKDSAVNLYR